MSGARCATKGLAATQAGEVATERQLTRRVAVGEPRQEEPAEQARKLLYIEDNEDNLYMLQLRFDVLGGYEVLGARDGATGIAMAATEQPDVILMDLSLPEIDGWTRRVA